MTVVWSFDSSGKMLVCTQQRFRAWDANLQCRLPLGHDGPCSFPAGREHQQCERELVALREENERLRIALLAAARSEA